MADTKRKLDETVQETPAQQEAQEQTSQASGTPDFKSDRDIFRAGVHVAMAPVYILPEESREHFFTAGREFTRGLSSLAQEIADDFDKLVSRENEKLGNE